VQLVFPSSIGSIHPEIIESRHDPTDRVAAFVSRRALADCCRKRKPISWQARHLHITRQYLIEATFNRRFFNQASIKVSAFFADARGFFVVVSDLVKYLSLNLIARYLSIVNYILGCASMKFARR